MDIIEHAGGKRQGQAKLWKWLLILLVVVGLACLMIYFRVQTKYSDKIVSIDNIEEQYDTAIVFGAGLKARGTPGAVLEDRVLTGIQAYQDGKVSLLLMSGDNSQANHNEVQAMENVAILEGVPEESIRHDHAGISTLESCKRARSKFGLEKVVLITQKYHLKRALYLCNELGLDAIGINATRREYEGQSRFSLREVVASLAAWFEIIRS